MSIYVNDCNKVNDIFINVNGKKKINSMWVNKNGNPTKVFSTGKKIYDFSTITWADGTDEEIAAMLDAHYAGLIDIHDYWHVGDERVVHLSAINKMYTNESHKAQDVTMVLMNAGGKTLTEPINGVSECAFIVGQKDCLRDILFNNRPEGGYMDSSGLNLFLNTGEDDPKPSLGGWAYCQRYKWCQYMYRTSFPITIRPIFKKFINVSSDNTLTENGRKNISNDYFSLFSEKEVFGIVTKGDEISQSEDVWIEYYKEPSHRIINQIGKEDGTVTLWWLRSIPRNSNSDFCIVNDKGEIGVQKSNSDVLLGTRTQYFSLVMFGCI